MTVNWKKLRHAYGPATELAKAFRDFTKDDDSSNDAYGLLLDRLVQPGAWFTASLPAVEELIGIYRSHCDAAALILIAEVMCGQHNHWLSRGPEAALTGGGIERPIRELVGRLGDELRETVERGDDSFRRRCAAFVLGCLPEQAEQSVAVLERAVMSETNPWTRGDCVFSLGVLCAWLKQESSRLSAAQSGTDDTFVRGMAALARVYGGFVRPRAVGSEIAEFLRGFRNYAEPATNWCESEPGEFLIALGRGVAAEVRRELVDALLVDGARRDFTDGLSNCLEPMLALEDFKEKWPERDMVALPEELTARQREVALGIASWRNVEGSGWGLPAEVRFIPRWLGAAAPSVLEECIATKVDGPETTRPRWWVLRREASEGNTAAIEALDAWVLTLAEADQMRLIADAWVDGYWVRGVLSNLSLDRLVELAERVEVAPKWTADWAHDLMKSYQRETGSGALSDLNTFTRYAVLRVLIRSNQPLKPAWISLTPFPWDADHSWPVLTQMPEDMRHDGILRNLMYQGRDFAVNLLRHLELFLSRPIIERLLELATPGAAKDGLDGTAAEEVHARLKAISASHPQVNDWVEHWKASHSA